jgi:glutaredoxin-like protein NrdH
MNITVYGQPGCMQCYATTKRLAKLGLAYEYFDVTEDEDARKRALSMGYAKLPVVVVKHGVYVDSWSGFRDTKIRGLVSNGD